MDDVREVVDSLLAEKPDLESDLEALLDVDDEEPWTFDEISLDSGTFGEVVSRGIVEEVDEGYQVADREAVRAALDGESVEPDEEPDQGFSLSDLSVPEVDRRVVLLVGGALAFVALVRIVFMWNSVFRGEHVVLAGNDPYYYRYWIDTLLASDLQAFDPGSLTRLPVDAANSDVLLIVVTWWAASLLGDGQTASGLVLAWYPVIAAVLSGVLVYLLAVTVTNDRRVGFASVVTLAVTPAHAYRTALGFGDHHAFDFVWLGMVMLALVVTVADEEKRSWPGWVKPIGVVGLGIGIMAQTTAWRGSPIYLLPIGGYVPLKVIDDVRAGRSPWPDNRRTVVGLVLGAVVTLFAYSLLGWMELYRAIAPALLALGAFGAISIGEVWHRRDLTEKWLSVVFGSALLVSFLALWFGAPSLRPALLEFGSFLTSNSNIAETQSLFAGSLGSVAGPILVFGLFFFLSLPYLVVVSWRAYESSQPLWLVPITFSWFLFVLSVIKLRFTGEFSLLVVLFAGVALVHLAERVDLARETVLFEKKDRRTLTIPDRRSVASLALVFLLFGSLGLIQTPVKMSQIAVDDETYQTATWIGEYVEDKDIEYPNNYVFSEWGENRIYNYYSNGKSESYRYARKNYINFIYSTNTDGWAKNELINTSGFVVVSPIQGAKDNSSYNTLYERFGSQEDRLTGSSHYRGVYMSRDRSIKVFEVVPGAHIVGQASESSAVSIRTTVSVSGESFVYNRVSRTNRSGYYEVVIPYSGEFHIANHTVNVSQSDVRNGNTVRVP